MRFDMTQQNESMSASKCPWWHMFRSADGEKSASTTLHPSRGIDNNTLENLCRDYNNCYTAHYVMSHVIEQILMEKVVTSSPGSTSHPFFYQPPCFPLRFADSHRTSKECFSINLDFHASLEKNFILPHWTRKKWRRKILIPIYIVKKNSNCACCWLLFAKKKKSAGILHICLFS